MTEATCPDESGYLHRFQYYLLSETEPSGSFGCDVYGICITSDRGTEARILALTTSFREIHTLIATLHRNAVGPAGLADVAEDWKKERAG